LFTLISASDIPMTSVVRNYASRDSFTSKCNVSILSFNSIQFIDAKNYHSQLHHSAAEHISTGSRFSCETANVKCDFSWKLEYARCSKV